MYICCSCILNPHHTVHKSHIMECTERLVPLKYGGNDSIKHLFWCTSWIAGKFAQQYFQEILQFKTFIFKRVSKSPTIRSDMNYFQFSVSSERTLGSFPRLKQNSKLFCVTINISFLDVLPLPVLYFNAERIDYAKLCEIEFPRVELIMRNTENSLTIQLLTNGFLSSLLYESLLPGQTPAQTEVAFTRLFERYLVTYHSSTSTGIEFNRSILTITSTDMIRWFESTTDWVKRRRE